MGGPEKTIKKSQPKLCKDLKGMMFGFGDVREPCPESVDLMEALCIEHICEITRMSDEVAQARLAPKDILFAVRTNKKQHNKAKEMMAKSTLFEKVKKIAKQNEK